MPKRPTKKQLEVAAALIGRTLIGLNELEVPYSLVIEGMPKIITNSTDRHAVGMLRDALELADKIQELRIEEKAMELADTKLHPDDEGGVK